MEDLKVEPVDEKLRRYKLNWYDMSKERQQQNAKNNVKLWSESTKTTRKTFEETIRRGRNRTVKAYPVTDYSDGDDDDDHISSVNFICEFYLTVTTKTNVTNYSVIIS